MSEEFQAWAANIGRALNAWAERYYQEVSPLMVAMVKALPKPPMVNRRELAARRARRRSERKVRHV